MPEATPDVLIHEAKAAVAFALDMPADQLAGYIVVGILPEGDYKVGGNQCCLPAITGILADVITQITTEVHGLASCKPGS